MVYIDILNLQAVMLMFWVTLTLIFDQYPWLYSIHFVISYCIFVYVYIYDVWYFIPDKDE